MTIPVPQLYRKYGDPARLVEFRVFSFNSCGAGCKNCFYQKTNNQFGDFDQVLELATELEAHDYVLETCYLLPTDVFENEFNYQIFDDRALQDAVKKFNYIGLASTLRNGFNSAFLERLLSLRPGLKIEMHVNIQESKLGDADYHASLRDQIRRLDAAFPGQILINLALNTGSKLDEQELRHLTTLVEENSHDRILELNFTFLFNKLMSPRLKSELLRQSYPIMQHFTKLFAQTESAFNSRTMLRKPSFTFKDSNIYLSPIIPFDEYVFLDTDDYRLARPDFSSFLETYSRIEQNNTPLWTECDSCDRLPICHGKGFFALSRAMSLPCIKEQTSGESDLSAESRTFTAKGQAQ